MSWQEWVAHISQQAKANGEDCPLQAAIFTDECVCCGTEDLVLDEAADEEEAEGEKGHMKKFIQAMKAKDADMSRFLCNGIKMNKIKFTVVRMDEEEDNPVAILKGKDEKSRGMLVYLELRAPGQPLVFCLGCADTGVITIPWMRKVLKKTGDDMCGCSSQQHQQQHQQQHH